jgi:RsmE family RNA methyltransferase
MAINETLLMLIVIMSIQTNGLWISNSSLWYPKSAKFHSGVSCRLNRFLFDEFETSREVSDEVSDDITVTLPMDDYRTIHAAKVLGLKNGDVIRCGIVSNENHGGLITDKATIKWIPEGKVKKAEPLGNGSPPGSLHVSLTSLVPVDKVLAKPPVSLILALPRPLALGRMLPMISQMGVETLVLTEARKVPKDYFGSHLFRKPQFLTNLLIEGLCQSGDVQLPKVIITRNLSKFLNDDLDEIFPASEYARAIAHPLRTSDSNIRKLRDVSFPTGINRRMLIAVGPEGGWEEPEELNHFVIDHGFEQVSMGNRVLRSDCAVVSLLALANDLCN